jgi:hypothetical protein
MIAALRNQDSIPLNCINQPMTTVYSARPEAGQLVLERFWLAHAGKRLTLNIPNQGVDTFQYRLVGGLPVEIVFPP